MSGDQLISSFGDPNAQPPNPKQTPTSALFQSPVFETPNNNRGSFDRGSFEDSSGWTPQFAEEYSVFNSTPGNLRGSQAPFTDFSITNPYQHSAGHKRLLSAENLAAGIATHVNHFSPNLSLPPVEASRRLASSPSPLKNNSHAETYPTSDLQGRFVKKVRRGILEEEEEDPIQTITPPPSARKGERKLSPKIQADTMQNDQGYSQHGYVAGAAHQQQQNNMSHLMTAPSDMFSFPMSAPATAPVLTDSRPFWDTDPSMSGMEMDFSHTGANLFHATNHRPMNSLDWGRSNEMFQEIGAVPQPNPENTQLQPLRKERALAPKPALPNLETNSEHDTPMFGTSFSASMDDPFCMRQVGGVDPGLLFTRPPSSHMEMAAFEPMAQASMMQSMSKTLPTLVQQPQNELRHSAAAREAGSKRSDRISAISPIKPTGRPGLSRCMSDNRGSKNLPTLAPAIKPMEQQSSSRPVARSNRKTSPLKSPKRLSSLNSIPETSTRTRTSVKFTIDSRGRARAETTTVTVDVDEDATPKAVRTRNVSNDGGKSLCSSSDESSSSDDEPIIIPSRNTSFALPDPRKPTMLSHPRFHSSQRSTSEQSTSSLGIYYNEPNDAESEAETVLNEPATNRGDAASELRKMKETRQKQASQRFVLGPSYSLSATISPITEGSLSAPSSGRGNEIRCVCNKNESLANSDAFLVQCESCEMWLHGKCINIHSRRTLPCVYICAFCANTPRPLRASAGAPSRSPLAHKSFKSFR